MRKLNRILSVLLALTLILTSLCTVPFAKTVEGETKPVSTKRVALDFYGANWLPAAGLSIVDAPEAGAVVMGGDAQGYLGAVYSTKVNVTSEVGFSFMAAQSAVSANTPLVISFAKPGVNALDFGTLTDLNQALTFFITPENDGAAISGKHSDYGNTVDWAGTPLTTINTFRLVKGADGWLLKVLFGTQEVTLVNVPFTECAADFFQGNEAQLSIGVANFTGSPCNNQYYMNNLYHYQVTASDKVERDFYSANWNKTDSLTLTDAPEAGAIVMAGNAAPFAGAAYKDLLEVSEELSFNFMAAQHEITASTPLIISFVKAGQNALDFSVLANAELALTFKVAPENGGAAISGKHLDEGNSVAWAATPLTAINNFKLVKEADGWALKVGFSAQEITLAKVPFTECDVDFFQDDLAQLCIGVANFANPACNNVYYLNGLQDYQQPEVTPEPEPDPVPTTGRDNLSVHSGNWTPSAGATLTDITGQALIRFEADSNGLDGAVYKHLLNVGQEIGFDFMMETCAVTNGSPLVFSLVKEGENALDWLTLLDGTKALTFIVAPQSDNQIAGADVNYGNVVALADTSLSAINTFKIVKEADKWSLKVAFGETEVTLASIPFTQISGDLFADDLAQLTVGVADYAPEPCVNAYYLRALYDYKPISSLPQKEVIDIQSNNWIPVGESTFVVTDVQDKVSFTGNPIFATGVALKNKVDISNEFAFDICFTDPNLTLTNSFLAITFGKDAASFNDPTKGATYILHYVSNAAISCQQNPTGAWNDCVLTQNNTFILRKGTDAWNLYIRNSITANAPGGEQLCGSIPFGTLPADFFTNDRAVFSFFVADNATNSQTVTYEISNMYHYPRQIQDTEDVGYDLPTYTIPYWQGNTMYYESAMVVEKADGSVDDIQLLYPAAEIISIYSADLTVKYEEGIDWILVDGKIRIPEGSSIPRLTYAEFYPNSASANTFETVDGKYILFSEGSFFHDRQIAITYRHESKWVGALPKPQGDKLPHTHEKLNGSDPLKVLFFGDSISAGANSSGIIGVAPMAPSWTQMFVDSLKARYNKDNIIYANTSEGGQTSAWGVANFTEKVLNENPDLLVIHFGMNDGNGSATSAQAYKANIQAMIASAKAHNPNIEIILVSPMLPNPEVKVTAGNQDSYEAVLNELCETGVIVAPVTSIYKVLMERKVYHHMTGNNVNHPNDFVARLYAQTLLAAVSIGEAPVTRLDNKAEDWNHSYNFTVVDKAFGVDVSGNPMGINGISYKHKLDISEKVGVSLKFHTMALTENEIICITFAQPGMVMLDTDGALNNSHNIISITMHNTGNGMVKVNYLYGAEQDGGCDPVSINWQEENTFTLEKGEGYWAFYITTSAGKVLAAKIPYEKIPENVFEENMATLSILGIDYQDGTHTYEFEVTGVFHVDNGNVKEQSPVLYPEKEQTLAKNDVLWRYPVTVTVVDNLLTIHSLVDASKAITKQNLVDAIASFKMSLDITGDWAAIGMRQGKADQNLWDEGSTGYFILLQKNGAVQLLKKTQSEAQVTLYQTALPFELQDGAEHAYRVGTVTEGDTVRIILQVDGVTIVNFVDQNPLPAEGEFSFVTFGEVSAQVVLGDEIEVEPADPIYEENTFPLSSDPKYWGGATNAELGEGTLIINSNTDLNGGRIPYVGSRLHDKLAQFKWIAKFQTSDTEEGWVGVVLRASNAKVAPWDTEQAYAYLLYIEKNGSVTLLKYSYGQPVVVGTANINVGSLEKGNTIRVGAITEASKTNKDIEYVKVILDMGDGRDPIIITDMDEPILKRGYTQFIVHGKAQATIELLTNELNDAGDDEYIGDGSGDGYIGGDINDDLINDRPDISDGPVFDDYVPPVGDEESSTQPTDPSEPTDSTDPTDPSEPTDSTDPTDPSEPTNPTDPTDATEPSQSTEPTEPNTDETQGATAPEYEKEKDNGSDSGTLVIICVSAAFLLVVVIILIAILKRRGGRK